MLEDGTIINELFIERLNYVIYVVLLLIGLHGMIAKNNLIKKLIGMSIFQTAIILFYVSVGVKEGATIPIYLPEHDPHASHVGHGDENATDETGHSPVALKAGLVKGYSNPLPHVLMLTAIVVGVATLGLALALCLKIYRGYGTIEEDELLAKIEHQDMRSESGARTISKSKAGTTKKRSSSEPKTVGTSGKSNSKPATKSKSVKSTVRSTTQTKKKTTVHSNKSPTSPKTRSTKPKPKTSEKKVTSTTAKKSTTQKKKAPVTKKSTSPSQKAQPEK